MTAEKSENEYLAIHDDNDDMIGNEPAWLRCSFLVWLHDDELVQEERWVLLNSVKGRTCRQEEDNFRRIRAMGSYSRET